MVVVLAHVSLESLSVGLMFFSAGKRTTTALVRVEDSMLPSFLVYVMSCDFLSCYSVQFNFLLINDGRLAVSCLGEPMS